MNYSKYKSTSVNSNLFLRESKNKVINIMKEINFETGLLKFIRGIFRKMKLILSIILLQRCSFKLVERFNQN